MSNFERLLNHLLAIILTFIFIFFCLHTPFSLASQPDKKRLEKLFSLSLEELLSLEIKSAGKRPEKVADIPATVTVITREDISNYGYTTLAEIIEDIPGIYNTNNYNGNSSNFGVRGNLNPRLQNTNFSVLVNGISQLRDDNRSNPFEKIRVPVESIDRIEFIRGPMSVIYGNGAFFGVINIVTNENTNHKAIISSGAGSKDTSKFTGRWVSMENQFKYIINASFTKTEGVDNKFKDMMTSDNLAALPSVGISDPNNYSTNQLLEDEAKYLNFLGEYKGFYFDATYVESNSELFLVFPSVDEGTINKLKHSIVTLGYKINPNQSLSIDSKITYNNHDQDMEIDLLYPGFYGIQDIDFESYHGEIITEFTPVESMHFIFGIDYRQMRNFKDFVDVPDFAVFDELVLISDRNTKAVYTQGTFDISNQLTFVAGYRYEKIEEFDFDGFVNADSPSETTFGGPREEKTNETPRIAAIYKLGGQHTLKFMYGEASRVSEDAFDPESIETFEINYLFNTQNIVSSISIYRNVLENILVKTLEIDGGAAGEKDSPSGEFITEGVEIILNWQSEDSLSGEFSIAAQNSKDKNNDDISPGFSPEYVVHSKLSYREKNQTFSISGRYIDNISTLYNPAIDNGDGSYGDRIGESVDAYFILDANYRHDNIYEKLYFNFRITNLLDEQVHYANESFFTDILNKGTIAPDRAFFATVGVKL